jgi:hypothetical protein
LAFPSVGGLRYVTKNQETPDRQLDILFGARALAAYIFADEEKYRKVYPLKDELGLFRMSGQICGRPATIDSRIAAREAASMAEEVDA